MGQIKGPIFIMGFPRSGTTGLASGLSKMKGISDFSAEGHFLYLFSNGIERIANGNVNPNCIVRQDDARHALFDSIAKGVDDAYCTATKSDSLQWIDKTPDIQQISAIPGILQLFPDAWFFFIFRDPVSSVQSNLRTWPSILAGKEEELADRWSAMHKEWRQKRRLIAPERRIQIYQPQLRDNPVRIVNRLIEFMSLDKRDSDALLNFWKENSQVNRPVQGAAASEYDSIKLGEDQKQMVLERCQAEMEHWKDLKDFIQ